MLDKIELNLDDIKDICKKHSFDIDHFWLEVNRRFSIAKSKNAGCRTKRNGIPVKVLFQLALSLPFFRQNSIKSFFAGEFKKMINCRSIPFYRFFQDSLFNWRKSVYNLNIQYN